MPKSQNYESSGHFNFLTKKKKNLVWRTLGLQRHCPQLQYILKIHIIVSFSIPQFWFVVGGWLGISKICIIVFFSTPGSGGFLEDDSEF